MIGSTLTGSVRTGEQSVRTADELDCACGDPTTPPAMSDLVWWGKGDVGVIVGPDGVTWLDQSGLGNDVVAPDAPQSPTYDPVGLDGIPGLVFSGVQGLDRPMGSPLLPYGSARTVLTVIRPSSPTGGALIAFGRAAPDDTFFLWSQAGVQYLWGTGGGTPLAPSITTTPTVNYAGVPLIVSHVQGPALSLLVYLNGAPLPQSGTAITVEAGTGFSVGNRAQLGFAWGFGFIGLMCEQLAWRRELTLTELGAANAYLAGRFPSV